MKFITTIIKEVTYYKINHPIIKCTVNCYEKYPGRTNEKPLYYYFIFVLHCTRLTMSAIRNLF